MPHPPPIAKRTHLTTTNTALATLRMSPEIDVADSFQSPMDVSGTISESDSDYGSELQEGDTYLPMEQDDITPDLYNPEFMEEDGD